MKSVASVKVELVFFQAGDQRWVRTAGSALHLLHSLYGPFSKIFGIGRCSKVRSDQTPENRSDVWAVHELKFLLLFLCLQMAYESWRKQVEEGEQKPRQAEIGNVFLIDRGEDPQRLAAVCLISTLTLLCVCFFFFQMWILSLLSVHKLSMKGL